VGSHLSLFLCAWKREKKEERNRAGQQARVAAKKKKNNEKRGEENLRFTSEIQRESKHKRENKGCQLLGEE